IAGMVVMQMRDDDVAHLLRVDADRAQSFNGMLQQLASARLRRRQIEAGIDDDGSLAIANDPDKIVDRHWIVVRVFTRARGVKKILRCRPVMPRIAQGDNLVLAHRRRRCGLAAVARYASIAVWSAAALRASAACAQISINACEN